MVATGNISYQAVAWQIAIFVNLNLNEFLKICILALFQFA